MPTAMPQSTPIPNIMEMQNKINMRMTIPISIRMESIMKKRQKTHRTMLKTRLF